jgi:hypothetical protein
MPRDRLAWDAARADDRRVIHDVDQLLEKLVKRDALNGSSVDLVFEAPTKDWVARRSGPAVDLYLYDIREDLQRRVPAWEDVRDANGTVTRRHQPPRRFRLAYLVTAWTQRPEDEHRLLSSLLACFLRNPFIKAEDPMPRSTRPTCRVHRGRPAGEPGAVPRGHLVGAGRRAQASLDLVVTAPIVVDSSAYIGPPVQEGPSIGISSTGGASESHGPGGAAGPAIELDASTTELLPANAGRRTAASGSA